jgi:hypothetical protein
MRISWAMLGLAMAGCASVRLVQREQCWVRQTTRLGQVKEELGPCRREPPAWSQDRLTRIVQECMAQADYRWQNLAVAAWARGERLPARPSEDASMSRCLEQASRSMVGENERLKERLAELTGDRDAQAAQARREREHFLASWDKLAGDLGEAAKRPLPPATATATATGEGRSTSEGRSSTERSIAASTQKPALGAGEAPAPGGAAARPARAPPAKVEPRKEACPPAHPSAAADAAHRPAPVEAEVVSPAKPATTSGSAPPTPKTDGAAARPERSPAKVEPREEACPPANPSTAADAAHRPAPVEAEAVSPAKPATTSDSAPPTPKTGGARP